LFGNFRKRPKPWLIQLLIEWEEFVIKPITLLKMIEPQKTRYS